MAIERQRPIIVRIAGTDQVPAMTGVSGSGFRDIENPQVRADLRTGDLLISSAFRTEAVREAILYKGIPVEAIAGSDDLVDLSPGRVIKRIREVVGLRGAVTVVEKALEVATGTDSDSDGTSFLNGDRDLVEATLFKAREELIQELGVETTSRGIRESVARKLILKRRTSSGK